MGKGKRRVDPNPISKFSVNSLFPHPIPSHPRSPAGFPVIGHFTLPWCKINTSLDSYFSIELTKSMEALILYHLAIGPSVCEEGSFLDSGNGTWWESRKLVWRAFSLAYNLSLALPATFSQPILYLTKPKTLQTFRRHAGDLIKSLFSNLRSPSLKSSQTRSVPHIHLSRFRTLDGRRERRKKWLKLVSRMRAQRTSVSAHPIFREDKGCLKSFFKTWDTQTLTCESDLQIFIVI